MNAQIIMWTDHTKSATTVVSNLFNFNLYMLPCIVTKLIATPINKVEYTIGASPVTSLQYTFTQVPQCNYG